MIESQMNKRRQPLAVKSKCRRADPIVQVPAPVLKRSMAFLIEDDEKDSKLEKCVESNEPVTNNKSVTTFQGSSDEGSKSNCPIDHVLT